MRANKKSIQKVNVKYKEIGSGKDRAGIIRQINNIKALKLETNIPNKKLKSSSSLPALKYDSKIPEKKMINIFENCKSAWWEMHRQFRSTARTRNQDQRVGR